MGAISDYESKLAAADAAIKASKLEVRRLRRDNAALAKSEESWLRLQNRVVLLEKENTLQSRMISRIPSLKAEIKELKKTPARDAEWAALKAEIATLKKLVESDPEIREAELARSRKLHEEELCYVGREVFKRTKAFYAPLVEKVKAYLADRALMLSALLGVAKQESVLASLNTLEQAGVELPGDFRCQVEAAHEQAKADLVTGPRLEITECDLAEPNRLAILRFFSKFISKHVWIPLNGHDRSGSIWDVVRFTRKILEDVQQTSRRGAVEKTVPTEAEDDEGLDPE